MSPQKKGTLKKILEALVPYRELAQWFLLLIQEDGNDELKEKLYQEILQQIRNISSKTQQENIKKALKALKKKSNKTIKKDQDEAEKMLNDFIDNINKND